MALNDALIYWALDENSGSSISDASGNSVTASTVNSPSWTSPAKINSGVVFNGSSQYIRSTSNTALNAKLSSGVSVSLWVKFASVSGTQRIVSIEGSAGTDFQYYFQYDSSAGLMMGDPTVNRSASGTLSTATWYHVVWTTDWTLANSKIYLNGTSQTMGGSPSAPSYVSTLGYVDVAALLFGSSLFYGNITTDEIGIWGRTLSGAEVTSLYNSGSGFNPYASVGGVIIPPELFNTMAL